MPIQYKLSAQQKEEIKIATGPQQVIADRYGVHKSTVSKIKCGNEYKRKTNIFDQLGEGGRMACPGCGRSDYFFDLTQKGFVVHCVCGWEGDYSWMLFVKEESSRCRERKRREESQRGKKRERKRKE